MRLTSFLDKTILTLILSTTGATSLANDTQLLFGDTHLHSSYSFDAFLWGNHGVSPDVAYRWAKGLPIVYPPTQARVQLGTPLDFLVVADHAELMGVIRGIYTDTVDLPKLSLWDSLRRWRVIRIFTDAINSEDGASFFNTFLPDAQQNPGDDPVQDPNNKAPFSAFGDTSLISKNAWAEIVDAAERHNDPGEFTSIIGWEWSSIPTGANLHRVVITPNGGAKAKQFVPFSSVDSQYPESLWQWMADTSARLDVRFIAIPHNSNLSKGYMFGNTTLKGLPITANYARTRMSWEPVVEATQLKGDSETHPALSPDDEFAGFEKYTTYIEKNERLDAYKAGKGDFVRSALKRGLAIEQQTQVNPYQFGVIGSTDAHTGLSSAAEDNFWGKFAYDSFPGNKTRSARNFWNMSASGLAAVWATDNTREAIFAAFKRKEVYATTGPRLRVQVFAGWAFQQQAVRSPNFAQIGYQHGVPMGGNLTQAPLGRSPHLLIRAVKDPKGANLDRVQVIKGWVGAQGNEHEKIFNVVWSGERSLDAQGRLSALPSTVDVTTGRYTNTQGSAELSTLWIDPEFNAADKAFYYVRVLQIATPRHSLYDAIALQKPHDGGIPKKAPTLQERAYTSAIWYSP